MRTPKRLIASVSTAAFLITTVGPDCTRAVAALAVGPGLGAAGGVPAGPMFPAASGHVGTAMAAFAGWLATPDGIKALSLNPTLADFQGRDFTSEAGLRSLRP